MKFWIAVNTNFVNKLDAGDKQAWWRYNNTFKSYHLEIEDMERAVRRGYSVTAVHHQRRQELGRTAGGGKRWSSFRHSKNFAHAQHLGLDFDAGDETSDPENIARNPFVSQYGAFVHTTSSSTLGSPRSRAFFVLDMKVNDAITYGRMAAALQWRFSGTADSSCTDPARVFFGSKDCDLLHLGNILPWQVAWDIVEEFERKNKRQRRTVEAFPADLNDREPVARMIEDALRYIPPQGEYGDWLRVLMAIHSAFPGSEGVALAERWSPGYEGEVERKFNSFSESGNAKGAVSLSTLYYMAYMNGWDKHDAIVRLAPTEGQVPL